MTTTPVKVALRVRPLKNKLDQRAWTITDERSLHSGEKAFTFDLVYSSQSTQEEVFKSSLLPVLQACTKGGNMTMLAYGQTGSGKSYSLGTGFESNSDEGLIQRCANWIFTSMIEKSSKSLGRDSFQMFVEMDDLTVTKSTTETIRLDSVNDLSDFLSQTSQSKFSLFSIILEQHIGNEDMITLVENDIPTTDKHIISRFNFVHLASECPDPLLSALGHRRHVPSGDCKLTRLLKDSSSYIWLLACVSPSVSDYTETLKTLENIRTIQNTLLPNDHDLLRQEINRAHSEIDSLRQQLADAKGHHFHGPPSTSSSVNRKKKRPVIHRMKSTQSCCLPKKKNNNKMDALLDLLRKEYVYTDEKSIDETVLHPSHAEADLDATVLDENELEALSVPSWSDAPKSSNGSSKRKSISLDSMWDDTDSSMTTTRTSKPIITASKSKESKRQSKNILKMLHQIQADLLVKNELIDQLENSQEQFIQLKANYEERLNELKNHILDLQSGRDAALKKSGITIVPVVNKTTARPAGQLRENRQAAEVRSQYEVKLKLLVAENMELKKKHNQSTHSVQTGRTIAESIISRLRADIEALKLEKKQLNKGLKIQVDKSRETISAYEKEVQILKRREMVALDAKKKLEQVNEAQGQVLKKRTEETAAVNLQIRQLTNVLRRAANEGTFLNEASLDKLLNEAPVSPKNGIRRPSSRLFTGNSSTTSSPID